MEQGRLGSRIGRGMHVRTADGHVIGAVTEAHEHDFVVEHPDANPGELARAPLHDSDVAEVRPGDPGEIALRLRLDQLVAPSAPGDMGDFGEHVFRSMSPAEPDMPDRVHPARSPARAEGSAETRPSGIVVEGPPSYEPQAERGAAGRGDPRPREEAFPARPEQRTTR